jgi:hypothetical protein
MKFSIFWDIALCSQVEVDRCFRGEYCLRHHGDSFIALMMEVVRTSEMSVNLNLTTRNYIPEVSKLKKSVCLFSVSSKESKFASQPVLHVK